MLLFFESIISGGCINLRDDERALTATWVLGEVPLAVEIVYEFLDIYDVYDDQINQYSRETDEGGFS